MDLNLIVAVGANGEIGRQGDLIWHIPADLKRFKVLTMGHPVIMGRKTWESLPKKPLPGRRNIILSSNPQLKCEGAEVVSSLEEALQITRDETPFVIGGANVYHQFLPYVSKIFLTEVLEKATDADTFLNIDPFGKNWTREDESEIFITPEGVKYRYVTLHRH